ncbi:DDE-type integrase/transposase/recombinase [Streptomyces arboris]|uniref:DDE-type integrase/transposase/recombinase n=1 Tax=Streptomyces arboris TaxID=2600619 RepID=UPI0036422657
MTTRCPFSDPQDPVSRVSRIKGQGRADKKARPAPDLIGREFYAETPGTKLVGDITALPTGEGWLYLACWLDLVTREVVGYSMADHHRADLVIDALDMAHGRGGLQPGCVIHSDRGSEYTSTRFQDRIRELELRQSCGRTGSCFDNAAAESFWALLKEEIGTRVWPRPGHRPYRRLRFHRDVLQPAPTAQTQGLRLPHPDRDPPTAPTHPRGITIECPRSRGSFTQPLCWCTFSVFGGALTGVRRQRVAGRARPRRRTPQPSGCRFARFSSAISFFIALICADSSVGGSRTLPGVDLVALHSVPQGLGRANAKLLGDRPQRRRLVRIVTTNLGDHTSRSLAQLNGTGGGTCQSFHYWAGPLRGQHLLRAVSSSGVKSV